MVGFRVVAGPDTGQIFHLTERLTFGRSNSILTDGTAYAFLSDSRVSREHLLIYREHDVYYAIDKYSSNGTYINGHRLRPNHPTPLQDQTEIQLGITVLKFVLDVEAGSDANGYELSVLRT